MATAPEAVRPMEGDGPIIGTHASRRRAFSPLSRSSKRRRARFRSPIPETIVVADYGASEGRNSLLPIASALRALRPRAGAGRAINVVHTDLPDNDFSALFETLKKDPLSYLKERSLRLRLCRRALVLRADPAAGQRHARLELVGDPVAQPRSGGDFGSGPGRL